MTLNCAYFCIYYFYRFGSDNQQFCSNNAVLQVIITTPSHETNNRPQHQLSTVFALPIYYIIVTGSLKSAVVSEVMIRNCQSLYYLVPIRNIFIGQKPKTYSTSLHLGVSSHVSK